MNAFTRCTAIATVLGLVLTSACVPSSSGGSSGDDTLVVQAYGGEYKGIFQEAIGAPFTKETGIEIKYVVGGSASENYAAIRAAGGQPGFDISVMTDQEIAQGGKDGLLASVPADKVPNKKNNYPAVAESVGDNGVVQELQQVVMMYDEKRFSSPPTSWQVMWDPKYRKGTIVWNPTNVLGVYELFIASELAGGGEQDVEPGWRKLDQLTKYVVGTPTSSSEAVPYMEKGTASVFPYFDGRAAIYAEQTHYDFVTPQEGTYALVGALGIPKDAEHKDAAYELMDYWLRKDVQERWARSYNVGPGVQGTELPTAFCAKHICDDQQLAKVTVADTDNVAENRAAWLKRWQGQFK